jgi:hypothetical protein
MKRYVICAILLGYFSPITASATDGSSGNSFFEMVFGNPDQRSQSRHNQDSDDVGSEACEGYGGLIGGINSFFCHMEKDMGITGPGSATRTFAQFKIRAEIALAQTTINSVSYNYTGSVWVCDSSAANCSLTANFSRMYYIAFSYDKTSGINKGYALTVPGSMNGHASDAMEIIYDLGSASATQSIQAKATFSNGGSTFNMRVTGVKTATSFKLNVVSFDGVNGTRFAASGTPATKTSAANYYNMYYEGSGGTGTNGFYTIDAAALAAPSTANGMCVLSSEHGSTANMANAGGSCGSLGFQAFDYYALTASGSPSAQGLTAASILGTWQGMPLHPSAL